MSFYTSLSGLKAAQTDLSVVSNNVANVGSTGFKKSKTEFGDIISAAPLQSSAIAGQGTRLRAITQQFTQGGFETSDRALDLALSGQGFFVTRSGITGGQVAFTRNGTFSVDKERFVTDSSGAFLQVLPVDSRGSVTATSLDATRNLQLPLTSGQPKATSLLKMAVTLPVSADLPSARPAYTVDTPYEFSRFDPNSYNQSTATTVYDAVGNALPATLYFTRTKLPTSADPTSQWEARLFIGDQEISSDPANPTPPTPLTLTFNDAGQIQGPLNPVQYADAQPVGAIAPLSMSIDFGLSTKQASAPFTISSVSQDGFAAGQLDGVTVAPDGLVTASFSNGETQPLGKLILANFANPSGLRQIGDAKWTVTGESGDPIVGTASADSFGTIQSGALERSNVDITEELVALISAQRNFQANAKAIETANTMTQAIINLRN
ncbi:flagellar hook protein FlgE [Sphingomonas laterariae]|uniref:Flagellar hook protein FlgE n=1 Tax=Edaphosphingomonas laterariae TaxID=861865 RepID=A0A239HW50_9SPHN|nr:flagellar hook protein FlgE [Sphingomonas laterariae]SNS84414.1 flagellar hook protein FlgE [Sphingomonas laterariae]